MPGSERRRELRRRRHRKKKVGYLVKKAEKASASEKSLIADKLRRLTPGGHEIVAKYKLEK